ncbi:MAG: cysteine dioxygenase [Synechococcaceae bacterium WB9_2_112]|nr:cysteine dioxygenase [Synechococcaceae bacterium WB9_2_112]
MNSSDHHLPGRLARFVAKLNALLETEPDENTLISQGTALLTELIATEDWLPPHCTCAGPDRVVHHLLYLHPDDLYSVVSCVWGPGQTTPIHDHTVWGLIGMVRGVEVTQRHGFDAQGLLQPLGSPTHLQEGTVDAVSPRLGDIHQVWNGVADSNSISIHVYGADIGKRNRHAYLEDGRVERFVSGYVSLPEVNNQ